VTDIQKIANDLLFVAFDDSLPDDVRLAAHKAHLEVKDQAFLAALADFRAATFKFVDLSTSLTKAAAGLSAANAAKLAGIRAEIALLHAKAHDAEGMRTTWEDSAEFEETFDDEAELPAGPTVAAIPAPPTGLTTLASPTPMDSHSFADLENEYLQFFAAQKWKTPSAQSTATGLARRAMENRDRYHAVGGPLGIPWWFIAGIHLLESSYNFGTHLHNGDSLAARTFRVPANRPEQGAPPFTWEESATDALKREQFADLPDWSLARALYRWEAYNGFGYRSRGVPTPYLWSLTSIYRKGKFVGDGVFSPTAVSKQCGAAALLKALMEINAPEVAPIVEIRDEGAGDAAESEAADAEAVVAQNLPNIDGAISTNTDFKTFFEISLPDVKHFAWHEFLVKGGSHAGNGLNTDPPSDLWPNVVPLARVLDKLREEAGHPVILTSVYRSPEYNDAIPGAAKASQHRHFCAADFKIPGHGSASDWHALIRRLRDGGLFSGGIGKYNSFVHVDTRGVNADW
jgi:lysozyme family protein